MQEKPIHSERQKFSKFFTHYFLVIPIIISIFYLFGLSGLPETEFLKSNELLLALIFSFLLWILMKSGYLETNLFANRIEIKFSPFHSSPRIFYFDNISHIELRKYNPILEYGGWGIRYRTHKNIAYNVKGSEGIQLYFQSGKKILIGTQELDIWKEKLKDYLREG